MKGEGQIDPLQKKINSKNPVLLGLRRRYFDSIKLGKIVKSTNYTIEKWDINSAIFLIPSTSRSKAKVLESTKYLPKFT